MQTSFKPTLKLHLNVSNQDLYKEVVETLFNPNNIVVIPRDVIYDLYRETKFIASTFKHVFTRIGKNLAKKFLEFNIHDFDTALQTLLKCLTDECRYAKKVSLSKFINDKFTTYVIEVYEPLLQQFNGKDFVLIGIIRGFTEEYCKGRNVKFSEEVRGKNLLIKIEIT